MSPRRLALADLDPDLEPASHAREVVANLEALREALALADREGPIQVTDLCQLHARLMVGTRDDHLGGVVRTEQNWIGGHTPLDAAFVPPPHARVPALLDDLCAYLSGSDHSPLVQAALVHAQLETIHPFADGNGRTGRALLHVELVGRSPRAIDGALALLVDAGVLKQVRGRARYRVYEAVGAFALVTHAERALASPALKTRVAKPSRPGPARKPK